MKEQLNTRGVHKVFNKSIEGKHLRLIKMAARILYFTQLNSNLSISLFHSQLLYNVHEKWQIASKQNITWNYSSTFQVRHWSHY